MTIIINNSSKYIYSNYLVVLVVVLQVESSMIDFRTCFLKLLIYAPFLNDELHT